MSAHAALRDALADLERIFDDALDAVMPNPVALRFTDLPLAFQGKRDLVFALALLEEGENEAALIAGLAHDALAREPTFDPTHLLREAYYYLRTSIDPAWQFDEPSPTFAPALAYVGEVVRLRVAAHVPSSVTPSDAPDVATRRALLARVRGHQHGGASTVTNVSGSVV